MNIIWDIYYHIKTSSKFSFLILTPGVGSGFVDGGCGGGRSSSKVTILLCLIGVFGAWRLCWEDCDCLFKLNSLKLLGTKYSIVVDVAAVDVGSFLSNFRRCCCAWALRQETAKVSAMSSMESKISRCFGEADAPPWTFDAEFSGEDFRVVTCFTTYTRLSWARLKDIAIRAIPIRI